MAQTKKQAAHQAPRQRRRDDRVARPHRAQAEDDGAQEAATQRRRATALRQAAHAGAARSRAPAIAAGIFAVRRCSSACSARRCRSRSRSRCSCSRALHPAGLLHRPSSTTPQAQSQARQRRRPSASHGRPHVHRRAGAGELLRGPPRRRATSALIVDPGDEAERILAAVDELGVTSRRSCSRTRTSTTSAPSRRSRAPTGAPVYCPELETSVLADIMSYVPWPGFGPFESYDADADGRRRRAARARRLRHRRASSRPATAPATSTYAIADEEALFSGDVLFQGSVGRTDLPGGDWPTLLASIARRCWTRFPTRPRSTRGTWASRRSAASAPATPSCASSRPGERAHPGAARHVRRAARRRGRARGAGAEAARRSSSAAGYRRIETPTFEATELFARGVGESTDIVQKEMYTFEDGGGRSLTLRPEGTAPVCRRLRRARHAQAAAAGEALVPVGPFFRHEAPAGGPLPPVLAGRGRGDRLRRPGRRRRDRSCCWPSCSTRSDARGVRLRISSLGTPEAARRLPRGAAGLPARARGRVCARGPRAHRAQPAARLRRRRPGHAGGHGATRRGCSTASTPTTREHFAAVRALLDAAGVAYEVDPTLVRGLDYYTRTVFEFEIRRARRPERRRRRRALRRAGRAARRPADARRGLGGRGRAHPARRRREPPVAAAARWTSSSPSPSPSAQRGRAFRLAREARRAGLARRSSSPGRSLKGQLKQADRAGARFVAILGDDGASCRTWRAASSAAWSRRGRPRGAARTAAA